MKNKKSQKKKHPFIKFVAVVLALFLFWRYNNYHLTINKTSVTSPKISEPVRFAVLSDLHTHDKSISNGKILEKLEKIDPDAVFVLGDMYSRGSSDKEKSIAIQLMQNIAKDHLVYFVPGDHDTSENYLSTLSDSGVHVMCYTEETFELKGNRFKIMGIDNVYYTPTFDLNNAFRLDESCYNILLAHIPNYGKFSIFGTDLTLCADTHGGMARLPFIGPLYDSLSDSIFPTFKDGKVYDKGWFEYNGGAMFITSGIGDSPYPVRLFNLPEIVSLEILPEAA